MSPRLPGRTDTPSAAPPEEMHAPSSIKVEVRQFRFVGNTLLSNAVLHSVVAPWLGHTLDFRELRKATMAVAEAYRNAGWIARAYLPHQDITDGTITLQIVEAVFGGARAENASSDRPLRLKLDRALNYIHAVQKRGEPVSVAALDRALLLIEDLPGTGVAGSLQPGVRTGETDLALKLSAQPLFNGDVALDNAGGRATGNTRLTASLAINSPLGLGEQASANIMYSEGSEYLRLGATLPVGANGWRAGASGSILRYQLKSPEFAALNAHGTSETAGIEASYPLIRSRLSNLYLNLNADHKRFDNRSGNEIVTRYAINNLSVGLQGNRFDNWAGGGMNAASVNLITGRVNLNGSPNQPADAITARTDGAFSKLRYVATRRQAITQTLTAIAALSGQWASKNLDSAEKFYLGGPYGVRAYPVNEGGGSSGQMVNLEARAALPGNLTLTGFYDWGHVVVNRHKDFSGAAVINEMTLQGSGLALGWNGRHGTRLHATWARRIGNNPNPTATGMDQDGSKVRNRFWLTASFSF